eukprot:3031390-Rhodomonas_salina.2
MHWCRKTSTSQTSRISFALVRKMNTNCPRVAGGQLASKTPGAEVVTGHCSIMAGMAEPAEGFSAVEGAASSFETATLNLESEPALENLTVPISRSLPRSTRTHCAFGSAVASAVFMQVSLSPSTANDVGGSWYLKKVLCLAPHVSLATEAGPHAFTKSHTGGCGIGCSISPSHNNPGVHGLPARPSARDAAAGANCPGHVSGTVVSRRAWHAFEGVAAGSAEFGSRIEACGAVETLVGGALLTRGTAAGTVEASRTFHPCIQGGVGRTVLSDLWSLTGSTAIVCASAGIKVQEGALGAEHGLTMFTQHGSVAVETGIASGRSIHEALVGVVLEYTLVSL